MGEPFYHTVILQRLDQYLPYDGTMVYYSREAFLNTEVWDRIPVIYKEVIDNTISHPDFAAVTAGTLLPEERVVGYIEYAYIPYEGDPRLEAVLSIDDAEVEQIARDGKLGISTGFGAESLPDGDNTVRIVGSVKPNHVLVFHNGACSNCYPRDHGAMFLNTQEPDTMTAPIDNESKGWLKAIHDKLCNTKPPADADNNKDMTDDTQIKNLESQLVQMKNTLDAKEARIAELEAAEVQRGKDNAWAAMKNTLPAGWVTAEKEPETRALFENNKDDFYGKLMAHKTQFGNTTPAQGSQGCGCPTDTETQYKNLIAAVEKDTGYKIQV